MIQNVDPDTDKLPNIFLQIRKSMDTGGSRPLTFKDGQTVHVSVEAMNRFVEKYQVLKPADRETMQNLAIENIDGFNEAVLNFRGAVAPKSIY